MRWLASACWVNGLATSMAYWPDIPCSRSQVRAKSPRFGCGDWHHSCASIRAANRWPITRPTAHDVTSLRYSTSLRPHPLPGRASSQRPRSSRGRSLATDLADRGARPRFGPAVGDRGIRLAEKCRCKRRPSLPVGTGHAGVHRGLDQGHVAKLLPDCHRLQRGITCPRWKPPCSGRSPTRAANARCSPLSFGRRGWSCECSITYVSLNRPTPGVGQLPALQPPAQR